jgi:hypothetical protein
MTVGSGFTSAPMPDARWARLQTGDSKAAGMRQPTALPSSPKTVPCPRTLTTRHRQGCRAGSVLGGFPARLGKLALLRRLFCGWASVFCAQALGDIRRDPPCLIFGEQLRRRRRSFLFDAEPKLLNTVQYSMGLSQGDPERRPVLSKVEARQGVTGHNVRYVLWFGLAAVIVAFAAIYFFYFD